MKKATAQQVEELQSALNDRELTKAEYIRVQAVLMRKLGQRRSFIAEVVGKSLSSVEDWISLYNQQGLSGLRTRKRKTQPRSMLTDKQRRHICKQLHKKPGELGLGEEEYWTMDLVRQLVEQETKVVYRSDNSYRRLLQEAGLSYQRVEFVDQKQDQRQHEGFNKQVEMKIKGGAISMWW